MGARMYPAGDDHIRPHETTPVTVTVDGQEVTGVTGQSIAGVIMAGDQLELRRTAVGDRPRGVFCGIGVCFDCIVEVNGVQDVRACQRKAHDGDVISTRERPGVQRQHVQRLSVQEQGVQALGVQRQGGAA